jgi:hypothetical protein
MQNKVLKKLKIILPVGGKARPTALLPQMIILKSHLPESKAKVFAIPAPYHEGR